MIITKSWLEEFLELKNISDKTIVDTLNNIGLEVSYFHNFKLSEKIVLGKIVNIIKHKSQDSIYICEVDIGDKILQVVSGALNILNVNYVAVAQIGSIINNSVIEESMIFGEINRGVICSSQELGLPELYKGVLIIDDSIGELSLGKPINDYGKICDTVIEIDLTSNRGDCLSIYGIARELSSALTIPLNINLLLKKSKENIIGLSRFLKISKNDNSKISIQYTIATMKLSYLPLLCKLRLGFMKKFNLESLESILIYISHSIGVIFKAYDISFIERENIDIHIERNKENMTNDIFLNNRKVSTIGFDQEVFLKAKRSTNRVLFEASYTHPTDIKKSVVDFNLKTNQIYHQISHGTNPDIKLGIEYLKIFFAKYIQSDFYTGVVRYQNKYHPIMLQINMLDISRIIGEEITLAEISKILKALYFTTSNISQYELRAEVPIFRHDINNIQDIAEEILRVKGINNIQSQPMSILSKNMRNDNVDNFYIQNDLINKIISLGFYENISYIFINKELQKKYGLPMVSEELDIVNPISSNFNTLRTSLILNLISTISYNIKYSCSSIGFFEIGLIYNEDRVEKKVISFVFSGYEEKSNILNKGKPKEVSIQAFISKISSIIPNIKLQKMSNAINKLIHPFQSANIIVDDIVVGYLSKLTQSVQKDFKIGTTFILEMDYDAICKKDDIKINIINFPIIYKDLTLIIDKDIESLEIVDKIKSFKECFIKNIYPIDIYSDTESNDVKSLTLRVEIQSADKTLEDKDIINIIDTVVKKLKELYSIEIKSI